MARLGDLVVADRSAPLGSGGAFLLKQPSRVSYRLTLDVDKEVEIAAGSSYAVVRFADTMHPTDTFAKAFETVHAGLTAIAARGKAYLEIRKAFEDCLLWWRKDDSQVLRVFSTASLGISMTATATVIDSHGNVIPPEPIPEPRVHDSLNHFRRSQTTDALFDSFREMYLAFENLISWRIPKQRKERDSVWLKRALESADSQVGLASKCSPPWSDFVNEFYSDIYETVRCGVFHSKDARQKLYPHRLADRDIVASALQRLGQIIILLYCDWLHVRLSTGGLTYAGFDSMTEWLEHGPVIIVSSSDHPLQSDETLEDLGFREALALTTRFASDESKPGLKIAVGSVLASDVTSDSIRRCGLKYRDSLFLVHRLEADLTLDVIDNLQVALGVRLRNTSPPKSYFLE